MTSIRKQTQHFPASSASLAYPRRHCLSCLFVGLDAWSWWVCLLFAFFFFPMAKILYSEAQNVGADRSHCFLWLLYFTPSICQSTFNLTHIKWKHTGREICEEKKVMYSKVRLGLKVERGFFFLSFCYCLVETFKLSTMLAEPNISHIYNKRWPYSLSLLWS